MDSLAKLGSRPSLRATKLLTVPSSRLLLSAAGKRRETCLPKITSLSTNAALHREEPTYSSKTADRIIPRAGYHSAPIDAIQSRTRNRYPAHNIMTDTQREQSGVSSSENVAIEIEADDTPIGQGRVVDPDAMTAGRNVYNGGSIGAPM